MSQQPTDDSDFSEEDENKFSKNGMRMYGVYSVVVFQMLATMGLSFWGGKQLNDYFGIKSNLLTLIIGLAGMSLAFYNLLRQLKAIQEKEDSKNK